jgi:hypothetical protein
VEPIETVAASMPPVGGGAERSAGPVGSNSPSPPPGLPILSSLPCTLGNLSKVLQPPAAGGAATPPAPAPGSGNLLSELLSPVSSLSPVLACDPTLAHVVGGTLQSLTGRKSSGAPPPAQGAGAPAVQGLDLIRLLQQLLGLTPTAH